MDIPNIVDLYAQGKSLQEIAEEQGTSRYLITKILKKENIPFRSKEEYRTYALNEHFFDSLNSEEAAYWFGFIVGDGHNNIKNRSLEIKLHSQDHDHLIKFHQALKTDSPLRKPKNQDAVNSIICSKYLSEKLIEYGIDNQKTFSVTFPDKFIRPEFWNHYIRGLFDADGSIYFKKNSKNYVDPVFALTGAYRLILKIQQILINELNLSQTAFDTASDNHEVVTLRYQGVKNVLCLKEYLYKNANIYLQRKYDKFSFVKKIDYGQEKFSSFKESIIEQYKNGSSTRQIAKQYGVNKNTITKFLRENNVTIREKHESLHSVIEKNKQEVITLYTGGESSAEIGKKFGVTAPVVIKFLKRWGIPITDPYASQLKAHKDEIILLHSQGISSRKIALQFNTNKTSILKLLKKYGEIHSA